MGINQLSREQRIAFVLDIWDTIAAESSPPLLTEAQRSELRRRVADDDSNPDDVVPWEQAASPLPTPIGVAAISPGSRFAHPGLRIREFPDPGRGRSNADSLRFLRDRLGFVVLPAVSLRSTAG
ncbi:MAG: addiction module protein [Planctomycetes bacterium]|nr:addiction module protein [Planctomycetota bacterium]